MPWACCQVQYLWPIAVVNEAAYFLRNEGPRSFLMLMTLRNCGIYFCLLFIESYICRLLSKGKLCCFLRGRIEVVLSDEDMMKFIGLLIRIIIMNIIPESSQCTYFTERKNELNDKNGLKISIFWWLDEFWD